MSGHNTMFKVYWTYGEESYGICFDKMTDALDHCKTLRESGRIFVTMVSENPDSIGKSGVDSVEDGMLPNGDTYGWKKRRQ